MDVELPYTKARRGQVEACRRITKYLGKKIVLKAPTGFGKTIVAIVSHSGRGRMLYAVRTINEMAPVIRELRRVNATYSVIFSASRMCPLARDVRGGEPEDFWAGCKILRVRGMCPYFRNVSKSVGIAEDILKRHSSNDPRVLTATITAKAGSCPFFTLAELAKDAEYVVVTYPYVFREEVFETAFKDVGPDDFYLVLDEAHTLLIPESVVSEEINEVTIEKALKEVRQYGCGEEIWKYLNLLKEVVEAQSSRLLRRISKDEILSDEGIVTILEDALMDIRLKKLVRLVSPTDAVSLSTKLSRVVKFLRYLKERDFRAYGHVREDSVREVKVLPLGYSYIAGRLSVFKGVLMMSGTMPPPRVLKPICGEDFIYIDVEAEYGRVFPRHNVFFIVVTGVTSSYRSRGEETYGRYAKLITGIVKAVPKGVILAVYPSYTMLSNVSKHILSECPQFEEGRETKYEDFLRVAKSSSKTLIHCVASGKLSEGLELLDDKGRSLIKAVVIAGVPYPKPDDYARDFENVMKSVVESSPRTYVMELPAAIKVMQAAGRAVRSEEDEAAIVLADRRFLNPRLKGLLNVHYDAIAREVEEVGELVRRFLEGRI